jgi:hypothetical protein
MTKQEAQAMYDGYRAEIKKTANYNKFVNEGGEGYEVEVKSNVLETIEAAGYVAIGLTETVYDRADFDAMREAWNNHTRSLAKGTPINIKAMQAVTGVNYTVLIQLKNAYVA